MGGRNTKTQMQRHRYKDTNAKTDKQRHNYKYGKHGVRGKGSETEGERMRKTRKRVKDDVMMKMTIYHYNDKNTKI